MAIPAALTTVAANSTYTAAQVNAVKAWTDFLANLPSCKLYLSGTSSIADDSAEHAIPFTIEGWDYSTPLHDTVTGNTKITIPTGYAGIWRFEGCVEFATNATGFRWAAIRKAGTTDLALSTSLASGSAAARLMVAVETQMAAGEYVELCARQNSGGALVVNGNTGGPTWFSGRWMSN